MESLLEVEVVCEEVFLGVSLRKIQLTVSDALNPSQQRQAEVWKVAGFMADSSGQMGPIER